MPGKKVIKIKVADDDEKEAKVKGASEAVSKSKTKVRSAVRKKATPVKTARAKKIEVKKKISVPTAANSEADKPKRIEEGKMARAAVMPAINLEAKLRQARIQPAKKNKINVTAQDALAADENNAVKKVVAESSKPEAGEFDKDAADIKPRRSIRLYRKIAYSFIALTFILLAVVFYFSFIKVTIVLIPNQERISNNMIIDIFNNEEDISDKSAAISGAVKIIDIEHTKAYPASGEEVIGEEVAGEVAIINNYTKNQPLVATTRLLSSDNKLYRIKDTVNVPAGGTVTVDIYADEPSEKMATGPTKFTIPGLWAGLQDQIYAENTADIVYQQKVKKNIVQEDIDKSKLDIKEELLAKAKKEINAMYEDYSQVIYKIDEDSISATVFTEVGDEKDEFSVSMEAEIMVVAFNDEESSDLAKQKFLATLADNKELISFDAEKIIYSLNNYNYEDGIATVSATFEGKVSIKENANIVEVDKILGLNKEQLDTYLSKKPELAGFEIKFKPSFLPEFLQKVPRLVDKISIEIKK